MHISILKGVQKGHICGLKNGHNLRKNDVLLKLNFQSEGHLDTYFITYILTILIFILIFILMFLYSYIVNAFFSNCLAIAYECTFPS